MIGTKKPVYFHQERTVDGVTVAPAIITTERRGSLWENKEGSTMAAERRKD